MNQRSNLLHRPIDRRPKKARRQSFPSDSSRLLWTLLFGALWALLWPAPQAFAADCYGLFGKGKYAQAASCFESQAKAIGANPQGTKRLEKGRLLRNAALSLDRAAKGSNAAGAAKYRLHAIELLQRYLKQKLYESPETRRATLQLLKKFRTQIGYALLTLVSNHPKAVACLQATNFRKCHTGSFWSLKLLPKTYQIIVTYPLNPPVKKQKVFIAVPRTQKTLVFSPPVKKVSLLSVVTSDPKATILLKGKKLKAPLTHTGPLWTKQLPPGRYELMVIYPGQPPLKRQITLLEGQSDAQVFTKPGPPVLVINTTPINAQVFINGKYSGNTGLRVKVKAGKVKVQIKRGCFDIITKEMTVQANKEYAINVILKRDPAYIKWLNTKKKGGHAAIGWSLLAAGVAFAGGGAAMYGLASSKYNEAMTKRPYDLEGFQQLGNENNTFVTVGHIGTGLGVVSVGVGIALLVTSRPQTKFDIPCKVRIKPED